MTDLRLEVGEGILLQTDDAGLYDGNNETDIDELYLTNKNIIYVHEKSTGVFKSETVVDKIPLSSIAVVNGIVQIQQVDDEDYGKALQIIYTSGKRELLELNVSPKKQYPVWQSAISDAVIRLTSGVQASQEVIPPISDNSAANNVAAGIATAIPNEYIAEEKHTEKAFAGATLFAGFKGVVDAAKQTITEVTQSATEAFNGTSNNSNTQTPIIKEEPIMEEKKYIFCCNCGEKLIAGSKFCNACGTPTGTVAQKKEEPVVETTPPPIQETVVEPITERKTVYEGNLHKCPNCGEVLNSFMTNCPTCGHEIRGAQGVSSVKQLAMKLEQLEAKRPPRKGTNIFAQTFGGGVQLQSIDEQKIDLIRNFSIPNTKEDVLEFIVLAAANIDLKVYGLDSGRYQMLDPARRELSDAWLAKLEQADQKAEIMFGHTQEYLSMRNVYEKKLKAINKQKHQIIWLLVGVFGSIFVMFGFVLMILALTGSL